METDCEQASLARIHMSSIRYLFANVFPKKTPKWIGYIFLNLLCSVLVTSSKSFFAFTYEILKGDLQIKSKNRT